MAYYVKQRPYRTGFPVSAQAGAIFRELRHTTWGQRCIYGRARTHPVWAALKRPIDGSTRQASTCGFRAVIHCVLGARDTGAKEPVVHRNLHMDSFYHRRGTPAKVATVLKARGREKPVFWRLRDHAELLSHPLAPEFQVGGVTTVPPTVGQFRSIILILADEQRRLQMRVERMCIGAQGHIIARRLGAGGGEPGLPLRDEAQMCDRRGLSSCQIGGCSHPRIEKSTLRRALDDSRGRPLLREEICVHQGADATGRAASHEHVRG